MPSRIEISVLWFDDDLVELQVVASSDRFAGKVALYGAHDSMMQLAENISGFPSGASDTRQFELGTFKPNSAGGGVHFEFYCTDTVGHAEVKVQLRGENIHREGEKETAQLFISVEASTVDSFVQQLKAMELQRDSTACLSAV